MWPGRDLCSATRGSRPAWRARLTTLRLQAQPFAACGESTSAWVTRPCMPARGVESASQSARGTGRSGGSLRCTGAGVGRLPVEPADRALEVVRRQLRDGLRGRVRDRQQHQRRHDCHRASPHRAGPYSPAGDRALARVRPGARSTALQRPVAIVRTAGEGDGTPARWSRGRATVRLVRRRGEAPPAVVLDFGKEVAGYPTFTVAASARPHRAALRLLRDADRPLPRRRLRRPQAAHPRAGPAGAAARDAWTRAQIEGGQRYVRLTLTRPGRVDLQPRRHRLQRLPRDRRAAARLLPLQRPAAQRDLVRRASTRSTSTRSPGGRPCSSTAASATARSGRGTC